MEITADELIKNLEEFLAGSDNPDLNSRDAAVAAAATAALLASWIAAQLAAGIKLDKIMEAVNLQQDRSIEAAQKTVEQGQKDAAVVDKDAVEGKDTGTREAAETPELDLRETRLRELVSQFLEKEKMHRVELEKDKKELKTVTEQVRLLQAQFEVLINIMTSNACIDVIDLTVFKPALDLNPWVNIGEKSLLKKMGISYVYLAVKNAIKVILTKHYVNESGISEKDVKEVLLKPLGLKIPPGGVSKTILTSGLKRLFKGNPVIGKLYDYGEKTYSAVSDYQEKRKTLESLSKKIGQSLEKQLKLEDQVHTHQVEGDFAHRRRVTVLQSLGEHLQKKGNTPGLRTR